MGLFSKRNASDARSAAVEAETSAPEDEVDPAAEATETVQINDAGQQIVVSVTKERGWWLDQEQVDKDTIIPAINTWYRGASTRCRTWHSERAGHKRARDL